MNQNRRLDAEEIRRRASGRWDVILGQICQREMGPLLQDPRRRLACPVHGGSNPSSFRLMQDYIQTGGTLCYSCGPKADGFATIMHIKGWGFVEALREVDNVLGGRAANVESARRDFHLPDPKRTAVKDDSWIQKQLLDMWNATKGLGSPEALPARKYFRNRGLVPLRGPLADVRFHPKLAYWEYDEVTRKSRQVGEYPALVSMVRQADTLPATLHRIYLTEDGQKAPVPSAKKQMPTPSYRSVTGAAIRLDPPGEILHVGEGVETSLAVRIIASRLATQVQARQGVWSCLSTSILAHLTPVPPTRFVCIWADHDENGAGQHAAEACAENLRACGYRVITVHPRFARQEGDRDLDWLDVLNRFGLDQLLQTEPMQTLELVLQREFQGEKSLRAAS